MKHLYIHDPSHGWLRVRPAEAREAERAGGFRFSSCSFQDRLQTPSWVYLEEDCDAAAYCRVVGLDACTLPQEYRSRFNRNMPAYQTSNPEGMAVMDYLRVGPIDRVVAVILANPPLVSSAS